MIKVVVDEEDRKELKKVFQRFSSIERKSKEEIFYDLCFTICTPQTTFVNNNKTIQLLREKDFYNNSISLEEMHIITKPTRFFRRKTEYLLLVKKNFDNIYGFIYEHLHPEEYWHMEEIEFRDFLCKNIKGLGMKVASHFLRNLGFMKVAILDTHILKFMEKSIKDISGKKKYKEVEEQFQEIAQKNNLTPAELDALIWKRASGTPWEKFKY